MLFVARASSESKGSQEEMRVETAFTGDVGIEAATIMFDDSNRVLKYTLKNNTGRTIPAVTIKVRGWSSSGKPKFGESWRENFNAAPNSEVRGWYLLHVPVDPTDRVVVTLNNSEDRWSDQQPASTSPAKRAPEALSFKDPTYTKTSLAANMLQQPACDGSQFCQNCYAQARAFCSGGVQSVTCSVGISQCSCSFACK